MTATPHTRPASPRLPRQARRRQLLGAAKPVLYQHFPGKLELYLALLDESVAALTDTVRTALASTTDNKQRVTATFTAFFDFVGGPGEAFRLVFESDLRNERAVRDRLDATMQNCAEMVSEIIREDAGIGDDEAHLLGMGLVGMAHVTAVHWLSTGRMIPKDAAEELMARLAWRGISGWPRTG